MKPGRKPVPVQRAIILYDRLRAWSKVARILRRKDGSAFTADGLLRAVRRYDRRIA